MSLEIFNMFLERIHALSNVPSEVYYQKMAEIKKDFQFKLLNADHLERIKSIMTDFDMLYVDIELKEREIQQQ